MSRVASGPILIENQNAAGWLEPTRRRELKSIGEAAERHGEAVSHVLHNGFADASGAMPMPQNGDSRPPRDGMTPSGWHDDAYQRDAGHDEMQAAWWREVRNDPEPTITRKVGYARLEFSYIGTWVEHPLVAAGRLIGFVDVATLYRSTDIENEHDWRKRRYYEWWLFYEIKPRIHSVGAVIRQLEATNILAARAELHCDVLAVVYKDDPKLELLTELTHFGVIKAPRPVVKEDRP
jgi:hypothetical protein